MPQQQDGREMVKVCPSLEESLAPSERARRGIVVLSSSGGWVLGRAVQL